MDSKEVLAMHKVVGLFIFVLFFVLAVTEQGAKEQTNSDATVKSRLDEAQPYRDDRVFCAKMISTYFKFQIFNVNLVYGKWVANPTSNTEIESPAYKEFGPNKYLYICSRGTSWSIYGTEGSVYMQRVGSADIPMKLSWDVSWDGDIWYNFEHHNLFHIHHEKISDDNHEFTLMGQVIHGDSQNCTQELTGF